MSDSWDDRRKAQEEGYFDKMNQQALERIKKRASEESGKKRPSPITGKPMEQVTVMGVVVDRCVDSGGIWLDAGELEEILNHTNEKDKALGLAQFFKKLVG